MKIIQKRRWFYVFSGLLLSLSIIFLSIWGLKPGIDFTGGVLLKVNFTEGVPDKEEIIQSLTELDLTSLTIQQGEDNRMLIRFVSDEDELSQAVQAKIVENFPTADIKGVEFISSSISNELKSKAIFAVGLAVVGIAFYIAWAFRGVSYPVSSWIYGMGAIVALVHDTLITLGAFAFLGKFYGIEVDIPFIAALLTILGYSVNDTIVIFDRVRENLSKANAKKEFENTVNNSIVQSLGRSINTSLTVIVVLVAIILFGGESIRNFSLALLIGVFFGTYSSVFVASALVVEYWKKKVSPRNK